MKVIKTEVSMMEQALITLTSSEAKRLVGKGIAALSEVQAAFKKGIIFVATSTSTGYVAEELLNKPIEKGFFTSGVVVSRGICTTFYKKRLRYIGIRQGVATDVTMPEMIEKWLPEMRSTDVFIKGANAIDATGSAAIFLGNDRGKGTGGTIGAAIGCLSARGSHLIIAAGLEKLVPGPLTETVPHVGRPLRYAAGFPSGMMLVKGKLVSEAEAFKTLSGVNTIPVAGGGINGAEGCHTFILEGTADEIDEAWKIYKGIKGEPPLTTTTANCDECERNCQFNIDPDLKALRKNRPQLGGYL